MSVDAMASFLAAVHDGAQILVTVDLDLAEVARHWEEPLLENPRLDLLLQEPGRLTTNRQEAGVHRGDGLFVA